MLFESMVRIFKETGIRLKHINLGGGFPVNYLNEGGPAFPAEQSEMFSADFEPAAAVRTAWHIDSNAADDANARHLLDEITLLLEPGRSIIADAGICLTTVRNSKIRPVSETTDHQPLTTDHWLMTDAGFNILLSMETYKWYYHLISATRASESHATMYKLAGPLCDGGDVYFDIEGSNRLPDRDQDVRWMR